MFAASPTRARAFFSFVADGLPHSLATTSTLSLLFGNYYYVLTCTGSRFLNLRYLDYQGDVRVAVLSSSFSRRAILTLPGSSWHDLHPFAAAMRNLVHPWLRE